MASSNKRLPPLNTIAAFEASARHMSFTRAAKELCLSQGAISRQIQILEQRLGVPLFVRRHKEIQLTRPGVIFQQAITESLGTIRRAVAIIETLDDRSVSISASVAMSSFWLMPAILTFTDEHPDIKIRVVASDELIDPSREHIDLTIRYGDVQIAGMETHKLFDEEIFPVCSPAYRDAHPVSCPEDLTRQTLIEYDDGISSFTSWDNWLKLARIRHPVLHPFLRLSNYDLVYRAMCGGKGIGLSPAYSIPAEARDTLLVRALDMSIKTGLAEHIVYPDSASLSPSASFVLDWLLDHARCSIWSS